VWEVLPHVGISRPMFSHIPPFLYIVYGNQKMKLVPHGFLAKLVKFKGGAYGVRPFLNKRGGVSLRNVLICGEPPTYNTMLPAQSLQITQIRIGSMVTSHNLYLR
jgi:hypothetical protein